MSSTYTPTLPIITELDSPKIKPMSPALADLGSPKPTASFVTLSQAQSFDGIARHPLATLCAEDVNDIDNKSSTPTSPVSPTTDDAYASTSASDSEGTTSSPLVTTPEESPSTSPKLVQVKAKKSKSYIRFAKKRIYLTLPPTPPHSRSGGVWCHCHGMRSGLSHFEDFAAEIGYDLRKHHLCCVPKAGRSRPDPAVAEDDDDEEDVEDLIARCDDFSRTYYWFAPTDFEEEDETNVTPCTDNSTRHPLLVARVVDNKAQHLALGPEVTVLPDTFDDIFLPKAVRPNVARKALTAALSLASSAQFANHDSSQSGNLPSHAPGPATPQSQGEETPAVTASWRKLTSKLVGWMGAAN